jgi:hypothetical protein
MGWLMGKSWPPLRAKAIENFAQEDSFTCFRHKMVVVKVAENVK